MLIKNKLMAATMLFPALCPALILVYFISIYSVNVPYNDDWMLGFILKKSVNSQLSISDFFSQRSDSRMFFPQLIFYFLALLTNWNIKGQIFLTFVLACTVSFNIYVLTRLTLNLKQSHVILLITLVNLLIFGLTRGEIWLWGSSGVLYFPIVCLTASLAVCYSSCSLNSKFFFTILFSAISTFSYAIGLFSWLLIFPALIINIRKENNYPKRWIAIYFACMVSCIILYFWNYKFSNTTTNSLISYLLSNPFEVFCILLTYLGLPAGSLLKLSGIKFIGLTYLMIFSCCVIYMISRENRTELFRLSLPWITIALYSLISGALITFGRGKFGIEHINKFRYYAFSSYFPVALVFLITCVFRDLLTKHKKLTLYTWTTTVLLIFSFLNFQLYSSTYAVKQMQANRNNRLGVRAYLAFINVLPKHKFYFKHPILVGLYNKVSNIIPAIQKAGLWELPVIENRNLKSICTIESQANACLGLFQGIRKKHNNTCEAYGTTASLLWRQDFADAVLISYKDSDGNPILLNYTVPSLENSSNIDNCSKNNCTKDKDWRISFSKKDLPQGPVEITAWAYDALSGKAYPLKNTEHLGK